MRSILFCVLLASCGSHIDPIPTAQAQSMPTPLSVTLGAQYGANAGFNQQSGCVLSSYAQCVQIGKIVGWSGTQTVKASGVELLATVICNGTTIWQGEQFQGTIVIQSPAQVPASLTGPCHIEYQLDSANAIVPGGAWEMQLTLFTQ